MSTLRSPADNPALTLTQEMKMASQKNVQSQNRNLSGLDEMSSSGYHHHPSHEDIAKRAYEIYMGRGGQEGRHHDDWLQAEFELQLGR
jgi:hypothetical protein